METVNTLLVVGLAGFGAGVVVALVFVLLAVLYHNVNCVLDNQKKQREDDESDSGFVLPLSSVLGGGGIGRGLSLADLQAAAQRMAAQQSASDDSKKAQGGQYL